MKHAMRSSTCWTLLAAACAFAGLHVAWHASQHGDTGVSVPTVLAAQAPPSATPDDDDADLVKRGAYLARVGDCYACHTADKNRPFAGGVRIATPVGTLYTPNITPDPVTGIGQWTDADFLRALHEGIGKGGERLYPAFPYPEFTRITSRDVQAIFAYLKTVAPVRYAPPHNELGFPFNQRWLLMVWNLFNFTEGSFVPDPKVSAEVNRGAYLVLGLGHCERCHTPRNFMQGLKDTQRFSGATRLGWQAYNITSDRNAGLGAWSDDALRSYLSTGIAPGHASAAGPMAELVQNSTQYLADEDLRSIIAYLRTVPPVALGVKRARDTWGTPAHDDVTALRGADIVGVNGVQLFVANCASCHHWSGEGIGASAVGAYPSLIHNSIVGAPQADNLVMVILHGVTRTTQGADVFMPAFDESLSNDQIAAIANYVTKQFGNPQTSITVDEVAALRAQPQ